jgi:hypothetical protein
MNTQLTELIKGLTGKLATWLIPILTSLIAAVIGSVVAKAAVAVPWLDLSSVNPLVIASLVAGGLVAIIVGTLNGVTTYLLKKGTTQVQDTLNKVLTLTNVPTAPLTTDGIAGANTNKGAAAVVELLLSLMPLTKKKQ